MNPNQIQPGIYPGLGMDVYHGWKLDRSELIDGPISCSMLKAFAPNPYAWARTPDIVQTDAMRKGSLFDLAVTDPDMLDASTVVSPFDSFRSKEAREWKAETIADGLLITTDEELAKARLASVEVRSHHIAGEIMENAQFQVGVVGEIGGIPAKCLLDILPDGDGDWGETLVDYKTTSFGLDDEGIRKAMGQFKYHWQAAFYRSLFNKVSTDRNADDFVFMFQDTATLEIRVVRLADDALALGTRAIKSALLEFTRCAHKGIGSRYAKTCTALDLMPYHAMAEDEKLSLEDAQ